jgi:hypothetical protein
VKLNPKGVIAEFINSEEDYTIKVIMGAPTFIYGDSKSKKKNCKGVAFTDTQMMRRVAADLIIAATIIEKISEEGEDEPE